MACRFRYVSICLFAILGTASAGFAQECVKQPYCEGQTDCESSRSRCCHKECRIRIPSIQFGFSFGCDKGGSCCEKECCAKKKTRTYWESLAPPEGPVVFSVPARPVREQAIAINPQTRGVEVRTEPCRPSTDQTELLLLLLLLQQQQQKQSTAAQPAATETRVSKSLEDELLKKIKAQIASQLDQ